LQEWRENVLGAIDSPQARLMNKVERAKMAKDKHGFWIQCDPMAAAILFLPQDAIQVKQVYASVELHGFNTRGAMVVDHLETTGIKPNVTVVEKIDLVLYKKLLLEAFAPDIVES
jgi:inosine-uridine nucleoside N-ribohydrolase